MIALGALAVGYLAGVASVVGALVLLAVTGGPRR